MTLYEFDMKPVRGLDVFGKLFAFSLIHNRNQILYILMFCQLWSSSFNQWLISGLTRNQVFWSFVSPCFDAKFCEESKYTLMSFNPFYAASFVLFNVKEVLLLHIENIKGKLFQNKLEHPNVR